MLIKCLDRRDDRQAGFACLLVAVLLIIARVPTAQAGVLSESDQRNVASIKPLFQSVMGDLVQLSQRKDLPAGEAECVNSTMRELLQISDELASYEYLMTIESQLSGESDDPSVRGVLKFAFDKSVAILASERPRLDQLSQQCARFAMSGPKVRESVQFIDTASAILNSIQGRI